MNQYENDAADMLAAALAETPNDDFNTASKVLAGVLKKRDEDVQELVKELEYAGALSSSGKPEALLFQEWATKCGFDMEQDGEFGHFINTHTQAARKAWRVALIAFPPTPASSVLVGEGAADAKSALVNDAERKYLGEVFDCLPDSMSDFLADFLKRLTPARPAPLSLLGSGDAEKWIDAVKYPPAESGRYWCYVSEQGDLGVSHYQANCSYSELHGFMENMKPVKVTHCRALMPAPGSASASTDGGAGEEPLHRAIESMGLLLAVRPEAFEAVREAAKGHEGVYMSGGIATRLISIMDAAKVVLDIHTSLPADEAR